MLMLARSRSRLLAIAVATVLASLGLGGGAGAEPAPSSFPCAVRAVLIVPVAPRTYAMEMAAMIAGPIDVMVTLFTHTHSYDLSLPARRFYGGQHLTNSEMPFGARMFFSMPDDETIEAAYAMDSIRNGDGASLPCNPMHLVLWDALRPSNQAAPPLTANEREATRVLALAYAKDAPKLAGLATLRPAEPALSCAQPYQNMHLTSRVAPMYPEGARQFGVTGRVAIQVDYTPETNAVATHVYSSSGSAALDASANTAAANSRYSPEVFRCEPQRGSYLLVVDFARR